MNETIVNGAMWYMVFLFSTTCHEAAHAFAGWKMGDDTAYKGGQVTLDPRPHIRREIWGMAIIPLVMFMSSGMMIGWASTPYDRKWALTWPRRSALMSLAGPVANFLLLALAALCIRAGIDQGAFVPSPAIGLDRLVLGQSALAAAAGKILSVMFSLNLILFLFNLVPIPPMDGSGAIGIVLPQNTARKVMIWLSQPMFALIGLLGAWYLFPVVFGTVFRVAIALLFPEQASQ